MGRSARLQRRVDTFRLGAYLFHALLLPTLPAARPPLSLLAGCAYLVLAPFAAACMQWRWPERRWPQQLENAVTALAAALLALPVAMLASVSTALLSGSVAQSGWRALPPCLATIPAGLALGLWLTPFSGMESAPLAELLSLLFIIAYTTAISALGYEQTMRMHEARRALRAKTEHLERLSDRLARYQAPALVRRIVDGTGRGAAQPTLALRRLWLSVCFVDLAEFTRHAERLAPEELAMLVSDFLAAMAELASAYGGTVDKFLGDGVLICFGEPRSLGRRGDALACAAMSAALPGVLRSLHGEWHARGLVVELEFHAAMASGFCSVGEFGSGERLDYTVIGPPVNLCSRLQDLAGPGEIWVCDSSRALIAEQWRCEAMGVRRIRGFAEPLAVHRLIGPRDETQRSITPAQLTGSARLLRCVGARNGDRIMAVSREPARSQDSVFLRACRGEATPHTPIWLNRQAGRYMPEYHRLKGDTPSLEFFKNPELAARATLDAQRILGVDAAIMFADLLPVLEPMGLKLDYVAGEGPIFDNPVRSDADVEALRVVSAEEGTPYIRETIGNILTELPRDIALIGFAGAPFTLASYAIEGRGSRNYVGVKKMMYQAPELWGRLMSKIVDQVADYVRLQIDSGVDAVQLFDSWIGTLSLRDYRRYVAPYSRALIERVHGRVPIISFGTGNSHLVGEMYLAGPDVMAFDWRTPLRAVWDRIGCRAAQGNLDPIVLCADRRTIAEQSTALLDEVDGKAGHIFNLGHGIIPETPVDNVKFLIDWVHERSRA